jgi:thiamine biosynthesis lipoprotein
VEKSKKSKSVFTTVAVIVIVALVTVGFFVYESKKPYEEKSDTDFAMGSMVTVKTYGCGNNKIADKITKSIKELDTNTLTNKVNSSLVGRINSGETVTLSGNEKELFLDCISIFSKTDGKAALTVGELSSLWDFDSETKKVPDESDILNALKTVDDKKIVIDGDSVYLNGDAKLDFGSVGKGAACDEAAEILDENGVENAVVAVGGSIFAKGHTAKSREIRVGIKNPIVTDYAYFGYIETDYAFISTSGNYEKAFVSDGKLYHHLLDCTTGYPVGGELVSVTVVCDNGARSDALATACFVLGYSDKTLSLLKEYNAEAVFVFADQSVKMSEKIKESFILTDDTFRVSVYES